MDGKFKAHNNINGKTVNSKKWLIRVKNFIKKANLDNLNKRWYIYQKNIKHKVTTFNSKTNTNYPSYDPNFYPPKSIMQKNGVRQLNLKNYYVLIW